MFSKTFLLGAASNEAFEIDEETLVKTEKKYLGLPDHGCAGTGTIKVHCSRKATVVGKKGEILVDGTVPFHGKLIN